jgi:hypothetical protein
MRKHLFALVLGVFLAGGVVITSLAMAAPPVCGRKACSEEIAACVAAQCGGLSGGALSACKRDCTAMVTDACDADPTVCNPTTTTTTSTTSTTVYSSPSHAFLARAPDLLE